MPFFDCKAFSLGDKRKEQRKKDRKKEITYLFFLPSFLPSLLPSFLPFFLSSFFPRQGILNSILRRCFPLKSTTVPFNSRAWPTKSWRAISRRSCVAIALQLPDDRKSVRSAAFVNSKSHLPGVSVFYVLEMVGHGPVFMETPS